MKLVDVLLNEPERFVELIINLLKIILTLVIPFELFQITDISELSWETVSSIDISITDILFSLLAILASWFILWGLTEIVLFFFLRRVGSKRFVNKLLDADDISKLLKVFGLYRVTKGNLAIPSSNISEIYEIIESIEDENSMRNSFLVEVLILGSVLWFFLLFKVPFSYSAVTCFSISGLILILLLILLFAAEVFIREFKKNYLDLKNQLNILSFRNILTQVVVNHFKGGLNSEETHFEINYNYVHYNIIDLPFLLEEIGDLHIKSELEKRTILPNTVVITNYDLDPQTKYKILEKEQILHVSGQNEEELIVDFLKLFDRINNKQ